MSVADGAVIDGLFVVWLLFVTLTVRAILRPLDAEIPEVKVNR